MTSTLPTEVESLLSRPSSPPLIALKPFNTSLTSIINSLSSTHSASTISSLHLLNDDLSSAHSVAQANEVSMTCNLVHATLHRREKDFWNSKWWLQQITHPILEEIHGGRKGACQFVDQVEALVEGKGISTICGSKKLDQMKEIQWREMEGLVRYSLKYPDQ